MYHSGAVWTHRTGSAKLPPEVKGNSAAPAERQLFKPHASSRHISTSSLRLGRLKLLLLSSSPSSASECWRMTRLPPSALLLLVSVIVSSAQNRGWCAVLWNASVVCFVLIFVIFQANRERRVFVFWTVGGTKEGDVKTCDGSVTTSDSLTSN